MLDRFSPSIWLAAFYWSGIPVCFTGTHDNETMEGWWADSANETDKTYLKQYLGLEDVEDVSWIMMREAFKSISRTAIVMMQV